MKAKNYKDINYFDTICYNDEIIGDVVEINENAITINSNGQMVELIMTDTDIIEIL